MNLGLAKGRTETFLVSTETEHACRRKLTLSEMVLPCPGLERYGSKAPWLAELGGLLARRPAVDAPPVLYIAMYGDTTTRVKE